LILILTHPSDFHAFAIAEALQRKGGEISLLYSTDFPTLDTGSIRMDSQASQWEISGLDLDLKGHQPATVWLRRAAPPVLPTDLDPADRQFALQECRTFLNCLVDEFGSDAFWVNSIPGANRANLKTRQLKAAQQAGLKIPSTLCSNNPAAIRRFITRHQGRAIYKAFHPMSWRTEDGVAALFSHVVEEPDLPEDELLQAVPGIYQEVVPKAYELRLTIMGQQVFATKIQSQSVPTAQMDWRAATEPVPLQQMELAAPITSACIQVMKNLGIVFGCFDLIVTPENDVVFLEVNEMGAFLWIEKQIPKIGLLDAFCEFLLNRDPDFLWQPGTNRIPLRDVEDSALRQMTVCGRSHIMKQVDTAEDA
jgi:hypothetical protein